MIHMELQTSQPGSIGRPSQKENKITSHIKDSAYYVRGENERYPFYKANSSRWPVRYLYSLKNLSKSFVKVMIPSTLAVRCTVWMC